MLSCRPCTEGGGRLKRVLRIAGVLVLLVFLLLFLGQFVCVALSMYTSTCMCTMYRHVCN